MHVIQSQITDYSYNDLVQKQIKLVRWWLLEHVSNVKDIALPFTKEQEDILIKFMDDHPGNFPKEKREAFDSVNLVPPILDSVDRESDIEKPCLLLIQARPGKSEKNICRRMDINLMNDELPVQLPFDIAGEIILEKI